MLSGIFARIHHRLLRLLHAPRIQVQPVPGLMRLGSDYGGWTFQPSADLRGATIISAGLGEDASFDVAFAAQFAARVILVDPTPRALVHFDQLRRRIGLAPARAYAKDGSQPVEAYDGRVLTDTSLILEPFALWTQGTRLKFFKPPNPRHVSHSIVNYQNHYSPETPYIEVEAITPEALLAKHGLEAVPLMKLDIEGAEIAVLEHMFEQRIFPRQLLIEFDELGLASRVARFKVEGADRKLRQYGYACRHFDGRANFLYILADDVLQAPSA